MMNDRLLEDYSVIRFEWGFSTLVLAIPVFFIFMTVSVILQIYVSKKPNKYYGLILPFISLLLLVLTAVLQFDYRLRIILLTLIAVPGIVHFIIYKYCRAKYKYKKQLEKMSIHDLE